MKSRKFKAVLAAVSAIAVLATAMTGFAAQATITTETTYNLDTSKASVTTTVSGLNDKDAEVTLLVSAPDAGVNGSGISYIDQKAASDGTAVFTYQLDKAALSDATAATVITGNDSANADDKISNSTLNVTEIADVNEATYTIDYNHQVYGNNDDKLVATINSVGNNEIKSITIGGVSEEVGKASYDVTIGSDGKAVAVVVETEPKEEEAGLTDAYYFATAADGDNKKNTTIMKITGNPYEVGVKYGAYTYPAARGDGNSVYVAVSLVTKDGLDATAIKPYYQVAKDGPIVEVNTSAVANN